MIRMRRPRVVVVGGGFAGLEAAFHLRRRLRDNAEIEMISSRSTFLYRPDTIYIPFGLDPGRLRIPLEEPLRKQDILFVPANVSEVDAERHTVRADGQWIGYDHLVLATGASMRPSEVPGLAELAYPIWTPAEMLRLRTRFDALLFAEDRTRVMFLVPPGNGYAGPIYELTLMLDTWLRRHAARGGVDLSLVTHETGFMQAFGPLVDGVIAEQFAARGIEGVKGATLVGVEPGQAFFHDGTRHEFDLLVTFPPHVASSTFAGLPTDTRGFLRTDFRTRQVVGQPDIYAAGDAADFPVKQAFLAFQQADVAADQIAASILGTEPRAAFAPSGLYVMDQLDQATFARVPLRATGRPEHPVEVDVQNEGYRVGTSAIWRLSKKLLGAYLPWRFRAGTPVLPGLAWRGLDLGLDFDVTSRTLAS